MRLAIYPLCGVVLFLASCASYTEKQAAQSYKPVDPPVVAPVTTQQPATGAIFKANMRGGLFANDNKASQVGDILTVMLMENNRALKSQSVVSDKTGALNLGIPSLSLGKDNGALSGSVTNTFEGVGESEQSNSLVGEISVMVVRRFANGNLEVRGQKKLTLNNGDEYVRVAGIVRPKDISSNNKVNSNRLANADIIYVGAGDVADVGKKGWGSKALDTLSPL